MRYSPSRNAYVEAEDSVDVPDELYAALIGHAIEASPEGLPRLTSAQQRADLLAAVTQKRWEVETGGIAIGGFSVKTGTSDQLRIDSVIGGMVANNYLSVPFKATSGWIDLTLAQVQAVRSAVAEHVRLCFINERAHHEAIAALDASGIDTYDINTGWPSAANNP